MADVDAKTLRFQHRRVRRSDSAVEHDNHLAINAANPSFNERAVPPF
jgi:hypothetical protein